MRKERKLDPTTGRGLYGAELRRVRTEAGLSLAQLADALRYSKTHLGNIETADRVPPPRFSEMIDRHFGTGGHFARLWPLARREMHPGKYARFMDLEATARRIDEYAAHVIPGLLQTEAYARCLVRSCRLRASAGEIDNLVAARLHRQERLRGETPPDYWVVLDESVIRRPVGGPSVMADQLSQILPLIENSSVRLQVFPYAQGAHPALGGASTLLTLPDWTTVAYVEGAEWGQLIEDPEDVEERRAVFDHLRAYALAPRASADFITSAIEELLL